MVNAKLLELGRADAKGNQFDNKYAEGRHKSKPQGVRLRRRRRSGSILSKWTDGESAHVFLPRW